MKELAPLIILAAILGLWWFVYLPFMRRQDDRAHEKLSVSDPECNETKKKLEEQGYILVAKCKPEEAFKAAERYSREAAQKK